MLNRRHFARMLGAGACLLPFLPAGRAHAREVPKRRLVIMWSLATNTAWWRPTSAPGQPVAFNESTAPLQRIAGDVVLVDGLSPGDTAATHGTPEALTGVGFGGQNWLSVDQFIAERLNLPSPLLLGVMAKDASQFMNAPAQTRAGGGVVNFGAVPPNDSPASAFAQLFGGQAPAPEVGASAMPRRQILDLARGQIGRLRATLGGQQRAKLDQHLDAIASIDGSIAAQKPAAGCQVPAAPSLAGLDPESQAATVPVGEAHQDLIVGALACGLTQVVGMQWGTTAMEYLSGSVAGDEHAGVHSAVEYGKPLVVAAETYLAGWFVRLVDRLRQTADPFVAGRSLLDTTLLVWSRDFGHQDTSSHVNRSLPYVLAGAPDYLPTRAGGTYLNFGGDNLSGAVGRRHERLLLNLCEAMGAPTDGGFGSLAPGSPERAPLPELRR